ncbi:hypothetical protein A2U01_0065795, partial [Trifolium medium]|nr:hypothetical protein [Trifolium medium]
KADKSEQPKGEEDKKRESSSATIDNKSAEQQGKKKKRKHKKNKSSSDHSKPDSSIPAKNKKLSENAHIANPHDSSENKAEGSNLTMQPTQAK